MWKRERAIESARERKTDRQRERGQKERERERERQAEIDSPSDRGHSEREREREREKERKREGEIETFAIAALNDRETFAIATLCYQDISVDVSGSWCVAEKCRRCRVWASGFTVQGFGLWDSAKAPPRR